MCFDESKRLITFARLKNFLTDKLTNGAKVVQGLIYQKFSCVRANHSNYIRIKITSHPIWTQGLQYFSKQVKISFYSSFSGKNWMPFGRWYFQMHFLNGKFLILIRISLKFLLKVPSDKKSPLFQVMAWCWTGNKPWWNYLSIPKLQRCNRWSLGMDK